VTGPVGNVREAWGHWTGTLRGWDPPHLVDWPPDRTAGAALCGRHIEPRGGLRPLGTADRHRVDVCARCRRRLADRAPKAPLIPLTRGRRRPRREP
jgi:hypothetical protein